MDIKVNLDAIKKASEDLSNWSRWGKDDQIGTLNLVTPDDIIEACLLYTSPSPRDVEECRMPSSG